MQIQSTHGQRSIQQYIHLTGLPSSTTNIPQARKTTTHVTTTNPVPSQPKPATGLPSLAALSLPSLIAGLSQPSEQPQKTEIKNPNSSNIDGKLLNNLAIALQLLIVSNILNSPPPESSSEKTKEIIPEPTQNQFYPPQNGFNPTQNGYIPTQNQYAPPQNLFFPAQTELVPGANFVGSANFAEPNLTPAFKPTRSSMTLMSPYEALNAMSDPVSQYTVSSARKDFQSPYAMIDKDLFSMNDLFS